MENRERDKMSRNSQSTSVGDVDRNTSSQIGKGKSDSSAGFGPKIGKSENLKEPNGRGSDSSGYGSSSRGSSGPSREMEPRSDRGDRR
jgi:hypothetical protein